MTNFQTKTLLCFFGAGLILVYTCGKGYVRLDADHRDDDKGKPTGSARNASPRGVSAINLLDKGNDGVDPSHPTLASVDDGFGDARDGRGWGDRCWLHIGAGKLGWAKAACQRGLAMADPVTAQPRASLLYNLGLIECGGSLTADKRHGLCSSRPSNVDGARRYFRQSLELRENSEVRGMLDALPEP